MIIKMIYRLIYILLQSLIHFPNHLMTKIPINPSSSLVGNSENSLVSNVMSLVYVVVMSCMSFIGWTAISLAFMGLLFHMSRLAFTTHGSNLKSPDLLGSLNCNCDLFSHSSLPMDPFAHGDTIPMIFYIVHEIYSNISEPHEIFYIFIKVLHQIGKKIHDFVHDMAATHEADFVESFNVI